jgi:hypothetical protein
VVSIDPIAAKNFFSVLQVEASERVGYLFAAVVSGAKFGAAAKVAAFTQPLGTENQSGVAVQSIE